MTTQKLYECEDNHEPIAYETKDCPLCRERKENDLRYDQREDIDQVNITELFSLVFKLTKRVVALEKHKAAGEPVRGSQIPYAFPDLWAMEDNETNVL